MYDGAVPPKRKPTRPSLKVFQIGNLGPPHSTENHLRDALISRGHFVVSIQESNRDLWRILGSGAWNHFGGRPDMIVWTRTGWPWGSGGEFGSEPPEAVHADQIRMLQAADDAGVPVVGYHLDIWWGLARETEIETEPFFRVPLLVTADGGHDDRWLEAGVNHVWFPPGVSAREAQPGTRDERFVSPLAFVGSWQGGYHSEHEHRHQLVRFLKANFRDRCEFYPKLNHPAVRGVALRDLYASVDLVIGDSAFAGSGPGRYCSDRIPETLGRHGFLLHPRVTGVTDGSSWNGSPLWAEGESLLCWDVGDWEALGARIEWGLSSPSERQEIVETGARITREHHTYDRRVDQMVDLLCETGMLK